MLSRYCRICELPGFENYPDYLIDIEGNVYSEKHSKLKRIKPGWTKKRDWLLSVKLFNNQGKRKAFYIHRLVALAFIPTDNYDLSVTHINGNVQDNRVENLEWDNAERRLKKKLKYEGFIMTEELSDKINKVHLASLQKGLPVKSKNEFIEFIFDKALGDYCNQYGLKRLLI
jgi:hypothetical protein